MTNNYTEVSLKTKSTSQTTKIKLFIQYQISTITAQTVNAGGIVDEAHEAWEGKAGEADKDAQLQDDATSITAKGKGALSLAQSWEPFLDNVEFVTKLLDDITAVNALFLSDTVV